MEEATTTITITESEAQRLVWALHRLSDWMSNSDAPQSRKEKGIEQNNALIDRIRTPFHLS